MTQIPPILIQEIYAIGEKFVGKRQLLLHSLIGSVNPPPERYDAARDKQGQPAAGKEFLNRGDDQDAGAERGDAEQIPVAGEKSHGEY